MGGAFSSSRRPAPGARRPAPGARRLYRDEEMPARERVSSGRLLLLAVLLVPLMAVAGVAGEERPRRLTPGPGSQ